jgi:hypothetical protein
MLRKNEVDYQLIALSKAHPIPPILGNNFKYRKQSTGRTYSLLLLALVISFISFYFDPIIPYSHESEQQHAPSHGKVSVRRSVAWRHHDPDGY